MNIKTGSGMERPQNSMDLNHFDQDEFLPYLSELVSFAKLKIPFYSRIYKNYSGNFQSADDFAKLPVVNEGMLVRERLEDMISDLHEIHEVCYPAGKMVSDCCMPRVQSQNDQEDQYLILEWILEECLDIEIKKDRPSIAMISDEDNAYSAGALCKMFIILLNCPFYGLVTRGHTSLEINKELSLFNPQILITSGNPSDDCIPSSVHTIIRIGEGNYQYSRKNSIRNCHLLTHPLLGIVGISIDDVGRYYYNPDHYYIETSCDNLIVYTSFMQKLMPVIRLRSRHWGKVIEPGIIEIAYQGTH